MADHVYVVRHGATEWSESGQHTSFTDLPLLEKGREQAAEAATKLAGHEFSLVLSSPLRRARETCELAGFGGQAQLDEDLREWNYGEYEGLTTPEIRETNPDWDLWTQGCPGGESPDQVRERVDRALQRIRQAPGNSLAFAHGHILRVFTARWLEMEVAAGARFTLAAAAIGVLGYEHDNQVMERWSA